MEVIGISIVVFSVAVLGLSVGAIVNGRQIKGHCGGGSVNDEQCIRDGRGQKIQSCPECTCETDLG